MLHSSSRNDCGRASTCEERRRTSTREERRWSSTRDERGQTEPLGALVAVAVVCLAITIYAGYIGDVLPGQSERAVEETALESAWHELGTDGVYDSTGTDPRYAISPAVLPEGHYVSIEVTTIGTDARVDVRGEALFDPGGTLVPGDPPADARVASRPIPVVTEPGVVRGGTLRVEVWQ